MKQFPSEEPHTLLGRVWLARMSLKGIKSRVPDDNARATMAMSETQQFACVAPPQNARALGLYFLHQEQPRIVQKYPKFAAEFTTLMAPVFEASERGDLAALYRKYNPTCTWDFIDL